MGTCTVVILTKNEEKHILAALDSARPCADQLLVVDSGSTAHTVAMAREAGGSGCCPGKMSAGWGKSTSGRNVPCR